MSEPTPVPLGLSSAEGRVPAEGGARLINCYADKAADGAKSDYPIYAADGFDLFSTLTGTDTGAIRGGFAFSSSALYVPTGSRIAKVAADGTFSLITGSIAASGRVSMERNRREPDAQIAIAVASTVGNLYFLAADTLTEFDLSDLGSAGTLVDLAAIDGYFVILMSNGEFYITAIDDATIDELDFAKAEANPDGGVAVAVLGFALVIFGDKSTEFWQNTGAADFPFERSTTRSYGCYAAGSVKNVVETRPGSGISDTLVFAASDSQGAYIGVCIMQGTEAAKISSTQIDRAIRDEANPSSIRSDSWSNGERTFYAISTSTQTFVYDFSTGFWHERISDSLTFWRGTATLTFGTKTIVGDYAQGLLYWMRAGLYNATDPCALTLKYSNDGGQSWVTRTPREIGGASNQTQRMRINRVGRGRHIGKTYEISISEAVMENGVGLPMTVKTPLVHAWPQKTQMAAAHIDIVPGMSQTSRPKGILGFALQADITTEQAH